MKQLELQANDSFDRSQAGKLHSEGFKDNLKLFGKNLRDDVLAQQLLIKELHYKIYTTMEVLVIWGLVILLWIL